MSPRNLAEPQYIVGIDLGTTNTVVAYATADERPRVFEISQLVTPNEIARRALLASALYSPAPGETFADPWNEAPFVVGELARRRGAAVPGRFIGSAKSWLSHPGVDREAPILPWGVDLPDVARLSPVGASSVYLTHVRRTWNAAFPEHPLEAQDVVLTVPASFDQAARELTLLAAERAGLLVRLLEEPQAAFYDFVASDRTSPAFWREKDRLVLVCDVGGGTTDLSLVKIGGGEVSRIAVGRHLLLGGDNMDLALAHLCEGRISSEKLDPAEFNQLVAACRAAKEALLGDGAPDSYPVAVAGSGSQLVGAARATRLTREETSDLLLSGFFPEVERREAHRERTRGALIGFGLPYERDVAITRHIAAFLTRHDATPDALLLNGGVFHSAAITERLRSVLQSWSASPIELLPHPDPDLAVARGAVAFGRALRGRGARIQANSPRGYYIGLAGAEEGRRQLVCVVPRGAGEAETHRVPGRTFALLTGTPARFDLFASDDERVDPAGAVVTYADERFVALPPLVVRLERGDGSGSEDVLVELEGELSPIGTLDLACVEVKSKRRHRLAFELRGKPLDLAGALERPRLPSKVPAAPSGTQPGGKRRAEASALIEQAFGKSRAEVASRLIKDLVRELERVLGDRPTWPLELLRSLFDELLPFSAARRRSLDHERAFWMLAGYTVRPGFGDPCDDVRVESLAALFREGIAFQGEMRGWQQFWIAYRRAAAGLSERRQTEIRELVDPFLAPQELKLKRKKGMKPLAEGEMLDMAASLERVAPKRRAELGEWVLERTFTDRDVRLFAALGRLGARVPAYASLHHVVPPAAVERWLDHLLREKWDQIAAAAHAAVELSRMTGDRARDVSNSVRSQVEKKLLRSGLPETLVRAVREPVTIGEAERAAFYGETLPIGIRLV